MRVVVTCEHASWAAPARAGLDPAVCASHVGWDAGALEAADALGRALGVPVLAGRWTRLWVDLNRSASEPAVIPTRSFGVDVPANAIPEHARQQRLARDWHPWRAEAAKRIAQAIADHGAVLHLSVHTFTPELDPAGRTFPLGVLFDPARRAEQAVADRLLSAVPEGRANQPYAGTDDGHTTALRRDFPDPAYAGVELELNQALLGTPAWPALIARIAASVRAYCSGNPVST